MGRVVADVWAGMTERFKELFLEISNDFTAICQDPIVKLGKVVYENYYVPAVIGHPPVTEGYVGFVDSGFTIMELGDAAVAITLVSAILRPILGGKDDLVFANAFLGLDSTQVDCLLLYVVRKYSDEGYVYRVSVKALMENNFLIRSEDEDSVSEALNNALVKVCLRFTEKRSVMRALLKYLIKLIELAYAVKVLEKSRNSIEYMVLDGSLLRWFTVGKVRRGTDRLSMTAAFLRRDSSSVRGHLRRIVGLSKTTSLTNLLRASSLFRRAGHEHNVYGEVNVRGLEYVEEVLNKFLVNNHVRDAVKVIKSIVKKFNTRVYRAHDIYVLRFPILSGPGYVFMLDIHSNKPIIEPPLKEGESVKTYLASATQANAYLARAVPTIFAVRESVIGYPPYGFMTVDYVVRMGRKKSQLIMEKMCQTLREVVEQRHELSSIAQLLGASVLLRHGYRVLP